MGPQQVLRAAAAVAVAASVASAASQFDDRVAIIDVGPADESVRRQLAKAIVAAGLEPLAGDGVDDALAGIDRERDAPLLAAALADAQQAFGALACAETVTAARTAIEIGAARQASGLAVPELARAWTYVLLCADRTGDTTAAMSAARHLRTLGGSADSDHRRDPSVLARYPEVDTLSNREAIELSIDAEVAGADIYVDFRRVGAAPVKIVVTAGSHVIAAGSGAQRGVLTGTVVKSQPHVTVPMHDQRGRYRKLAERVRGWRGALPPARELEAVLKEVGARVAIVRHGSTIEAWGHANRGEPVRRLGDDDGIRTLDQAPALAALIADRLEAWTERAPDPDQPLLVETREGIPLLRESQPAEERTKWWVYATVAGSVLAGALIIYAYERSDPTQRIELRYPR
jgi:hypothetical protein